MTGRHVVVIGDIVLRHSISVLGRLVVVAYLWDARQGL